MEYIALIKKDSFDCLFKYGRIHLSGNPTCIPNHIDEYKNDTSLLKDLFKEHDDFEMSFEYVLINYVTDEEDPISTVRIENVLGLYALDEQSINSLAVRLDPRIVINPPLWPNVMNEIKMAKSFESCKRGINNMWKISNLDESDKHRCSAIVTDEIIKEVVRENYNDEQPSGDHPIWVYLLRYQCHEMYPQNDMGYFLDTVHVFTNRHRKDSKQLETGNTDVFKRLMDYTGRRSYSDILSYIENTSEISRFREQADIDGFYRVAPLYLKLLEPFAERGLDLNGYIDGKPLKSLISGLKQYFGFDFSLAAYLLGIILGYDRTSAALYDSLHLNIFKKQEKREVPPFQSEHKEDDSKSDLSLKEEPSEVTGDNNERGFLTPPSSKRKATKDDVLTLDSIKELDVPIPCDIKCGNGKNDKKHIASNEELLKTLESQPSKSWNLYTPRKK